VSPILRIFVVVAGLAALSAAPAEPKPPSKDQIAKWIKQLGDTEFAVREKASQELGRLGSFAEKPLRKALESKPSAEKSRRIKRLLESLEKSGFSPERSRALRALEALELIGNGDAKKVLEAVAKGAPDAELTQEAKAALDRLAKKR